MAQSDLYKYSEASTTAEDVNVTSDDARDIGDVDVKTVGEAIDVTSDTTRELGDVSVVGTTNTQVPNLPNLEHNQATTTTSGTAESLTGGTSVSIPDEAAVVVKALSTNSGTVYVGDSTVTTSNGFELSPGESEAFYVDDLASLYVDVDTGGEGVSYKVEQN